ncbi:MAG: hypothetical protein K8I00_06655, partial [Candidatus Omnitrophica bacterium]|nr:hypothetical protein [Candidatus Omnitrophota bacterium]
PRSRATFWETFYGNLVAEIEAIEANNTLVVENGESVREYLERQIIRISQQYLLTPEETRLWLAALRGEEGGRFVQPEGEKARQTLYDIFFALGHKKTTGDVLALMEATSSHTQAAWEIFSNTPVNSMFLGIFNKNPESGKLSTLLGYNARKLSEWQSVVDGIEQVFGETGAPTSAQRQFIRTLRNVHEEINLIDLIYRDRLGVFSDEPQRKAIVDMMMRFLNEQRPTHGPVAESMATDILEYHLNVSEQLGDFAYNRFVQALLVSGEYTSVKDAFTKLSQLSDAKLADPATFGFLADAIKVTETERVEMAKAFLANYEEYQGMVDTKLRNIIHMEPLWRTNRFAADKTINNLGELAKFISRIKGELRDGDINMYGTANAGDLKKELIAVLKEKGYIKVDTFNGQEYLRVNHVKINALKKQEDLISDLPEELMKAMDAKDAHKNFYKLLKEVAGHDVLYRAQQAKNSEIEGYIQNILSLEGFTEFQGMSIPEWATQFAADRDAHQREIMLVLDFAFKTLSTEYQSKTARLTEEEIKKEGVEDYFNMLRGAYDKAEQTAQYVNTLIENGVDYVLYDATQDVVIMNNKNGGMATNLWLFFDKSVSYDAHVRTTLGQNIWRPIWATMQARDVEIAVVNPMMRIWASNGDAWEGTRAYAISQETWTSEVQRARKEYTTFYGKGLGLWHTFTTVYTPPGEDTAAFMTQQRTQPKWKSTHIDWYGFEWGRPNLLAESLVATETRYAFNVVRLIMDNAQFALYYNKNLGFDKKLSHMFMNFHYLL